jgi:hypothetical protein
MFSAAKRGSQVSDELMGWKALVAIKEARIAQLEAFVRDLSTTGDSLQRFEARQVLGSDSETSAERPCTCYCDDRPPECQHKYALSECLASYTLNRK